MIRGRPRKVIAILIVGIMISSITVLYILNTTQLIDDDDDIDDLDNDEPTAPEPKSGLTLHGPIIIEEHTDFEEQGWPGSGSYSDPYVIENLHIMSETYGILIKDPDVCFKIVGCIIEEGASSSIYLSECTYPFWISDCIILGDMQIGNCENGNVSHCDISDYFNVRSSTECVIQSNTLHDGYCGVNLRECTFITVEENTIYDCDSYGIRVTISSDCTFTSNILIDEYISFSGYASWAWYHELYNNTVNGKLVGYFWNIQNEEIDVENYGSLILANCIGVTVKKANFSDTCIGIQMGHCYNCRIEQCILERDRTGVYLEDSTSCTIKQCIINSCQIGIEIESEVITICDSLFNANGKAIEIIRGDENVIRNNTITDTHGDGIDLSWSSNIRTQNNTIVGSEGAGIEVHSCTNHTITDNILLNNGLLIQDDEIEFWNHNITDNLVNGKPIGIFSNVINEYINGEGYGQIMLLKCTNTFVENGSYFNASVGVHAIICVNLTCINITSHANSLYGFLCIDSENTTITSSKFNDNRRGIHSVNCSNIEIINNTFERNWDTGFYFSWCINAYIFNNTAIGNNNAFYAGASFYSTLLNCTAVDNNIGVGCGSSHYLAIKNCTIKNCAESGVELWTSSYATIEDNHISNSNSGVMIVYSYGTNMTSNTLSDSSVWITESYIYYYNHEEYWRHSFNNNTINGRPILYLWNKTGINISGDEYGQVIIANSSDITLTGSTIADGTTGVLIGRSNNCQINDCTVTSNRRAGVYIETSSNIVVNNLTSIGNGGGVQLVHSASCSIMHSNFTNDGVVIDADRKENWVHYFLDNNVNGRTLSYYYNLAEVTFDSIECGQLIVAACNDSIFSTSQSPAFTSITNVTRGLQIGYCVNCSFSLFDINNCSGIGVSIQNCERVRFSNSSVIHNQGTGIKLSRDSYCVIDSNIICFNGKIGIDIDWECVSNEIFNNEIGWNEEANAWDIGYNNNWDDGVSKGNKWNDYIGYGFYSIGGGHSLDRYPTVLT